MATSPGSFIAREDGREKEMDGGGVLGVLRGKQRAREGLVGGSRKSGSGGGGGWWLVEEQPNPRRMQSRAGL